MGVDTSGLGDALALCSIPSGMMLIGSFLVYAYAPGRTIVAAMQHLAGGIVLGATSLELVSEVSEKGSENAGTILGVAGGFIFGVALMLLIRYVFDDGEADDAKGTYKASNAEDPVEDGIPVEESGVPTTTPKAISTPRNMFSRLNSRKSYAAMYFEAVETKRASMATDVSAKDLDPENPTATPKITVVTPPFPMCFMIGVCVDGFIDGMTIGIVSSTEGSGGLVMALALMVEMFFLGLTFSAALLLQPKKWRVPSQILPPVMIIVGGTVGALSASALTDSAAMYCALLSFAIASLLYLVTEELLIEAHSNVDHIWYVDLMFFVGFLGSLMIELIAH